MSRYITDLIPDVRIAAAGCPEFIATYALTRALSEFLDRSEAWREWLPVLAVEDMTVGGLVSWHNHLDDDTQRWARIKRIDYMQWYPTGSRIDFKTAKQLGELDPEWRTRGGPRVRFWTNEGEGTTGNTSAYQIRIYPDPKAEADPTAGIQPRVVVITDTVANFDLDEFDGQVPLIPDRIFYAYREAIVSGALATLYLIPGKDWTDQKLAAYYRAAFESAITRAKSRADADYGNPSYTTSYGGI